MQGKSASTIAVVLLVLVIIAGGLYMLQTHFTSKPVGGGVTSVQFLCQGGKTIAASFTSGSAAAQPATSGQPPVPNGSVALTLSDGRTMTLPQTISADGIRYANADESFVFWSKGNGAFIQEGNTNTYNNCVVLAPDTTDSLPQSYVDAQGTFSIRYPAGYTSDASHVYQALGPGKDIPGVSFTIAASVSAGTNLGSDSYVSVEHLQSNTCNANLFLDSSAPTAVAMTDGGIQYSVASSTDAGAGNRYEVWVHAIPGTNPCTAVRYYIHYSAIENYPAGAVQEFNHQALLTQFDSIRRSLTLN